MTFTACKLNAQQAPRKTHGILQRDMRCQAIEKIHLEIRRAPELTWREIQQIADTHQPKNDYTKAQLEQINEKIRLDRYPHGNTKQKTTGGIPKRELIQVPRTEIKKYIQRYIEKVNRRTNIIGAEIKGGGY